MDSLTLRTALLAGLLLVAAGLGIWWRRRDGRLTSVASGEQVHAAEVGHPLGARATLLQFSSEVCAPCRVVRRMLADLARGTPEVAHVELDAAEHLALVRRLEVLRTPTVLVLDPAGQVVHRVSGVPSPARLTAVLADVVGLPVTSPPTA